MNITRKWVFDGTIAGLLGGLTVALWFLIIDLALARPLATPSMLGALLLNGTLPPAAAAVSSRFVIAYSALHFSAFVLFGIAAAWLIEVAERQPAMLSGVVLLFACFEFFFLLIVGAVSQDALAILIWWRILAANLLASVVMLGFFTSRHRILAARLVGRGKQALTPVSPPRRRPSSSTLPTASIRIGEN